MKRPLSGRSYVGQSGSSKNRDQKVREKYLEITPTRQSIAEGSVQKNSALPVSKTQGALSSLDRTLLGQATLSPKHSNPSPVWERRQLLKNLPPSLGGRLLLGRQAVVRPIEFFY
ncbi:hypothetical protein TNCV_476771 [Trichonephila clavipes]|nr:hypothetical protein TNCV_476771 [Trichonephila clavipes]